jgi:release factor glutamine methyltransferase
VLLAHLLGKPRAWVLAHPEAELNAGQQAGLEVLLQRLENGEPLPYVLGRWEFFGLEFAVTPAVLIPRPETELLVEQALAWLRGHPSARSAAEVGVGSGCISVSLAVHIPDLKIAATDLSLAALEVACANARRHRAAGRIDFVVADLLPPGRAQFDLICANLPYIPSDSLGELAVSRAEPRLALDGGPDGLRLIRRLLAGAPTRLRQPGLLLLEIEAGQGPVALALAQATFPQARVHLHTDLAGRNRLVAVEMDTR